jgi:hypothetical protein
MLEQIEVMRMPDARHAGLRGRRPVKPPAERFNIQYVSSYLKTPLPAPAYPVDVTGGITGWQMLGNGPDPTCTTHPNGVGDCTFAGRQHYRMAKAAAGQEVEQREDSDQLVAEYLAYDKGQDVGANIADLLLYWYRAGTILAFAPVDHSDPAAVDSAMAAFHGAYVGVNLTDDADNLFEQGQPWTTASGEQPDPNDGHCIVKVKADGQALDGWVTWGALQPSTTAWTAACLEEAWVVISAEDADSANLDIAALKADIDALGGQGGAPPVPAGPPTPPPAPAPPAPPAPVT